MSLSLMHTPTQHAVLEELRRSAGQSVTRISSDSRLHGLDNLRAGAALLVVLLHAAMPYMAHPLPTMRWAVTETTRSHFVDFIGWGINCFIMPLFFLMSGFLTSQASESRTARTLLATRGKRLGIAFTVGCVLILPLDLYAWLLGLVVQGEIPIAKLRSLKIEGQLRDDLSGVSHLWYLQSLAVVTLIAAIAKRFSPVLARQIPLSWSILAAATCAIAALRFEPEILLGFKNQWLPSPMKILFYMAFFAVGWRFANYTSVHQRSAWPLALSTAAIMLFTALFPEIASHIETSENSSRLTMLTIAFATAGGSAALGIFAHFATGFHRRPNVTIRYLAGASLWIYLFHHPVVAITQIDLLHLELSAELKTLVAFAAGVTIPLLTYQVFVKRTVLGRLLNGIPPRLAPVEAPTPPMRTAA